MKNVNTEPITLYTVKDIQSIFQCGKRQAYELFTVNGFPAFSIGRKKLVEKQALENWLAQNKGKKILV